MPASPAPVLSRRRQIGEASARSLLMTVLGEYVLPAGQPVWTSALVQALGLLGIEQKAARQALARTAAEGWLSSARHGRRVCWQLTAPGRRLLSDGADRIYRFGCADRRWDGQWVVLMVSVPEARRELRHRLRTRLSWAGFGSPAAGVWVSPDVAREPEAREILTGLGLTAASMSFLARFGTIGSQASVARLAWDLDAVAARYQEFIDSAGAMLPADPDELFTAQTRLVHEWRRFPFTDPGLPPELLPERWPGTEAARLFHAQHTRWRGGAQRRWAELAGRGPAGPGRLSTTR